jgi:excisionase family DNA binding protein
MKKAVSSTSKRQTEEKLGEYLKIPEVARRLDISEKTARRYIRSGELPSAFIGGAYRVSEEDLASYKKGAIVNPEELTARPKARTPRPLDDGAGDRSLRYLRAWRAFAWDLALEWEQNPPQTSREIKPLLTAITALLDAGAFEDTNADTSEQGELSLFRNALQKLYAIADDVNREDVSAELRASLTLIPDLRDQSVA